MSIFIIIDKEKKYLNFRQIFVQMKRILFFFTRIHRIMIFFSKTNDLINSILEQ